MQLDDKPVDVCKGRGRDDGHIIQRIPFTPLAIELHDGYAPARVPQLAADVLNGEKVGSQGAVGSLADESRVAMVLPTALAGKTPRMESHVGVGVASHARERLDRRVEGVDSVASVGRRVIEGPLVVDADRIHQPTSVVVADWPIGDERRGGTARVRRWHLWAARMVVEELVLSLARYPSPRALIRSREQLSQRSDMADVDPRRPNASCARTVSSARRCW